MQLFCEVFRIDFTLAPDVDYFKNFQLLLCFKLAILETEYACQGLAKHRLKELPKWRTFLPDLASLDQIIS